MSARRRRGLLLLCVALRAVASRRRRCTSASAGRLERLGPQVEVLVAARDIPAGARVTRGAVGLRRVPVALRSAGCAPIGGGGRRRANGGRCGSRRLPDRVVVQRRQSGRTWAAARRAGGDRGGCGRERGRSAPAGRACRRCRVDRDRRRRRPHHDGAGRRGTSAKRAGSCHSIRTRRRAGRLSSAGPTALATLRVSVEQAIYLTAADNFAREIRLMPRPRGDHTRAGGTVSHGQL